LINIERADRTELWAVDASQRASMPVLQTIEDEDTLRVTVLFYARPLSALALEPGRVNTVAEGRALPANTSRVLRMENAGEPSSTWAELDELPPELAAIRIPGGEGCRAFATRDVPMNGERSFAGAAELNADSAIVVVAPRIDADPVFYRIDAEGAHILPRAGELAGFRAIYAAGSPEAIYLSGTLAGIPAIAFRNAQDTYGLLDPGPVSTTSTIVRGLLIPPAGSEDSALLYTISGRGDVDRYVSKSLEPPMWEDFPENPEGRTGVEISAAWNAAADIFLLAPDGDHILRYAGYTYTVERTELAERIAAGSDHFRALVNVPGLGSFAGSDDGVILVKNGDTWNQLRSHAGTSAISVMAAHRNGFLAGTEKGAVIQYDQRDGFCEDHVLYLGAERDVRAIIPLEELVLIAGIDRTGGVTRAFVVLLSP
jgi:hypothetical protein